MSSPVTHSVKVQRDPKTGQLRRDKATGTVKCGSSNYSSCCCSPCYCAADKSGTYGNTMLVTISGMVIPTDCMCAAYGASCWFEQDTWSVCGKYKNVVINGTWCLPKINNCWWVKQLAGEMDLWCPSQHPAVEVCTGYAGPPDIVVSPLWLGVGTFEFDLVTGGQLRLLAGFGSDGQSATGLITTTSRGCCRGTYVAQLSQLLIYTDLFKLSCGGTATVTKNDAQYYKSNIRILSCTGEEDTIDGPYDFGSSQSFTISDTTCTP